MCKLETNDTDDAHIRVHEIPDGSRTVTCGAWILLRVFPNGRVRVISHDAPIGMMEAARHAVGLPSLFMDDDE